MHSTLFVGLITAIVAVLFSIELDNRAWEVESNYEFWTWIGMAMAVWAVVWNTAWAVGAIRSAARIGRQGAAVGKTSVWLLANLVAAIIVGYITLTNTQISVESWWYMVEEAKPPVSVLVSRVDTDGKPQTLLIQGSIGMGSTKALRAVLEMYPNVPEVELHSPGGMVVEGFAMTGLLVGAGVRTVVTRTCASACTSMFLAGKERVIGAKARLGFHRSYSITGDFGTGWSETDHEKARWMRESGVKEEFIQKALEKPGWDLWVPSHEELLNSGYATM